VRARSPEWRIVWAAFTVAVFAWGVGFYGPSVLLHELHVDRGWLVSAVSLAVTCHFLVSAVIVLRLPAIHRRFGLAAATRAGGLLAGLGVIGWALAPSPGWLFPATFLSGTGWALTSGAAINAIVAPWFDRDRPKALAMAFNGASVGGILFAPLWPVLIAWLGLKATGIVIGTLMAVVLWWVAGAYLRTTPDAERPSTDGETKIARSTAAPAAGAPRAPLASGVAIWRERRFATLSAAFALGLFAQIGLVAHLFLLLAPALGRFGAGLGVGLATLCAVFGRTALGWLLPPEANRRAAAALNVLVQAAGTIALLAAAGTSVPLLLVGCILFGLGMGNLVSLPPLIAQLEFRREDVERVVAAVTATNQMIFAFAPAALGMLRDLGGWQGAPLLLALVVQIVAAGLLWSGRLAPGTDAKARQS
jgi:MFS family permease